VVFEGIRSYFTTNPPGTPVSRAPITVAAAAVPGRVTTSAAASRRHVVRHGDTLSGVASRYRVSLSSLRAANRLRSDIVRVGQRLRIPSRQS
jgi:N-acetylmuramoyl-L-alanine amidase